MGGLEIALTRTPQEYWIALAVLVTIGVILVVIGAFIDLSRPPEE